MSDDVMRRLAVEQRKRLVASILGEAERSFWAKLSRREQEAFRAKVFDAAGSYHDFILDCIKVGREDGVVQNELSVRLIEEIHTGVRRLEGRRG